MAELNKCILDKLECPKCTDYMAQKIYVCQSGHSVCGNCRNLIVRCPVCFEKMTNSRNYDLEAVSELLHYPCVNEGCEKYINPNEYEEHMLKCDFRKYPCLLRNGDDACMWSGARSQILDHVLDEHDAKAWMLEDSSVEWIETEPNNEIQIIQAHGELFYFYWYYDDMDNDNSDGKSIIYWAVQYIGNPENAPKYGYVLHMKHEEIEFQELQFSEHCLNDQLSMQTMIEEGLCIGLPMTKFKNFMNKSGSVFYNVEIKVL